MDLNLAGRRALITGASRGIGATIAWVLAEEGCTLHLAARDGQALQQHAQRLREAHGVPVHTHPTDLRDPAAIGRLADAAGDIDILVNNAGDLPGGALHLLDDDAWRDGFALKVFGYISLTRHVYARMEHNGGGVIINNIGASGEGGDPDFIAGCTGNAALMAFTRALGGASLNDNIRVVGVNPGPVDTERIIELTRALAAARFGDADRYRDLFAAMPTGRPASTRQIADAIAFLASERSGYTSGTVLTIDGGLAARAGFGPPARPSVSAGGR